MSLYDRIGTAYSRTRRAEPRIAKRLAQALGDAASIVNIGAGTGSYEPTDRTVFAVEPSEAMIRQRPAGAAPAVRAVAEALPFADGAVDGALAVLTVHHWSDVTRGLREMRRVARRRAMVLTWDQDVWKSFWLVAEYLPGVRELDRRRAVPVARIAATLGADRVEPVPIPHDCSDGFHGAFWRRPTAYLDPAVRAGISSYSLLPAAELETGLGRLAADLESGAWQKRHRDLLELRELDIGYRLIVAAA